MQNFRASADLERVRHERQISPRVQGKPRSDVRSQSLDQERSVLGMYILEKVSNINSHDDLNNAGQLKPMTQRVLLS